VLFVILSFKLIVPLRYENRLTCELAKIAIAALYQNRSGHGKKLNSTLNETISITKFYRWYWIYSPVAFWYKNGV